MVSFEMGEYVLSNIFLLFKNVLANFGILHFHMNFNIDLSISGGGKIAGILEFDRDLVETVDQFGEFFCHLKSIKVFQYMSWDIFPFIWVFNLFQAMFCTFQRTTCSFLLFNLCLDILFF